MADIDHQLRLADSLVSPRSRMWRDYAQLTKLRLNSLALLTTLIGYLLASGSWTDLSRIFFVLVGAGLAAAGAGALNQYLERDVDALMRRTADRPLPAGRIPSHHALAIGASCVIGGVLMLAVGVNLLSGFLCALTVVSYLFVYTPLKRLGAVSTFVGAIPGAFPPLIGWAAARGELTVGAWVLFAILFTWQLPHFFSIAWIYREDYRRAGMAMISVTDEDGSRTAQQIVMCTLNVVFVSLLPVAVGLAGVAYFLVAALLGVAFLTLAARFACERSLERARQVMYGSLIYLPCVLSMWLLDRMLL